GLVDVFRLKVRVGGEDLIARAAGSQQPKQPRDREPEPSDARLSGANAGINRYSGEFHGISITVPGVVKKSRDRLPGLAIGSCRVSAIPRISPRSAYPSCTNRAASAATCKTT